MLVETYTLDFETFYDATYSLKKMTTEDYVFGAHFELICVTVRTPSGNIEFHTGTEESTKKFLQQFELEKHAVLAHNCRFDGLILARLGIFPKFYLDTLGMARPLFAHKLKSLSLASLAKHFKLGLKGDDVINAMGKRRADFSEDELRRYIQYCANDTALTYALYRKLRDVFPATALKEELLVIDQTLRMYLQPSLLLNEEALVENLKVVQEKKRNILSELEVQGVTGEVLRSNDKFAALLKSRGIEPPMKLSLKKTEKAGYPVMGYAFSKTDPEFIELQEDFAEDLEITAILNGRISEKSTQEETRTNKFIQIARMYKNSLRVALAYYKAHTGRYGGDEGTNMQNPPRVDKSRMRFAILPPPGHVMIVADLAQIEARITACLAGQEDLILAFRNGEDVYSTYACELYGLPPGSVSKKLAGSNPEIFIKRFTAKESILGLGFGMGANKFKNALRGKAKMVVDLLKVEEWVQFYRGRYGMIPKLWYRFDGAFRTLLHYKKETTIGPLTVCFSGDGTPSIRGPNGLRLMYPNLKYTNDEWTYQRPHDTKPRKIFGGMWTENAAQFLANIIIKQKMIRITKELNLLPRLQAHDAIGWTAPADEAKMLAGRIEEIMAEPPAWWPELPVAAEVKVGATYGDV
jgi:DNA polymerase